MADLYFDDNGVFISAAAWVKARASRFSISYSHGDDRNLTVRAWYSGLRHGKDAQARPLIYEVAVDGDPDNPAHDGYHRYHDTFPDQASCQADFDRVKAAIIRGDVL